MKDWHVWLLVSQLQFIAANTAHSEWMRVFGITVACITMFCAFMQQRMGKYYK